MVLSISGSTGKRSEVVLLVLYKRKPILKIGMKLNEVWTGIQETHKTEKAENERQNAAIEEPNEKLNTNDPKSKHKIERQQTKCIKWPESRMKTEQNRNWKTRKTGTKTENRK